MSQISLDEATDILRKLLTERVPVHASFSSPTDRTYVSLFGFVDSISDANGLVVSESGPPIDVSRGFLCFAFNIGCEYLYGEKRELAGQIKDAIPEPRGDSALMFRRPRTGELMVLFFTI